MKHIIKVLFFLIVFGSTAKGENIPRILNDAWRMELIKQTVRHIYNWEFTQAETKLNIFSKGIENHPCVPFAKSVLIFWKTMPLDFSSASYKEQEALLIQASEYAENMLDEDENDVEGIFFRMASRSLLMKHYADKGESTKAVGEARSVYKLMRQGFDLKDKLLEFYFTTGAYNYYREYYPERYPVYKPFMVFFQSGNKALGLQQLDYTAKNAVFTSAEAYFYLTYIYLRYEQQNDKALMYAKELVDKYPKNLYFWANYAETLFLSKRYSEIVPIIPKFKSSSDKFYLAMGNMYEGLLAEHWKKDLNTAFAKYNATDALSNQIGNRFQDYKVYFFEGLSACYRAQGNQQKSSDYHRWAKDNDNHGYLKNTQ